MESLHSNFLSSSSLPFTPSLSSSSSSRFSSFFPVRRRSQRRRRILAVYSPSRPLPFIPKSQLPSKTLSPLDLVRNSLSILIFSISIAFLPFNSPRSLAIAAPVVAATNAKSRKGSFSTEHEFSEYTTRLLESVAVLLRRIEDVKSLTGEMRVVREALKEVKRRRREIQGEVIEKLNSELRELKREKEELVKRSEEILDSALSASRERDTILSGEGAGSEEAKRELERLENAIEVAEKEYNQLWEKVGEIEDKMLRRETLTYSIAIRELGFIERESELLVERFSERLRQAGSKRCAILRPFLSFFLFTCSFEAIVVYCNNLIETIND